MAQASDGDRAITLTKEIINTINEGGKFACHDEEKRDMVVHRLN